MKPQTRVLTNGSYADVDLRCSMTREDNSPRWRVEWQKDCFGDCLQGHTVLDQRSRCWQHSACIIQHINIGVLNLCALNIAHFFLRTHSNQSFLII